MGPIYSIEDAVDLFRRRFWLILTIVVLGTLATLAFVLQQKPAYTSSEVLQIERPKIADQLAPSTVDGSSGRRLQLIEQQLMARGTLLEVIENFDLFAKQPGMTQIEQVAELRQNVSIEGVAAAREGFADDGTISVLRVTASMPTPELAQQIAAEFSRRTIELSADTRLEQALETLRFFDGQEEVVLAEIEALEVEIASFRARNALLSPGVLSARQNEMATLNEALLGIEGDIIAAEREFQQIDRGARRATIERQEGAILALVASLSEQRLLLEERLAELRALLEPAPELQRMQENFDAAMQGLRGQLRDIQTRRDQAEVGYRLERQRQSERLTVLEPAFLPEVPTSRGRRKLMLAGALGSFLAALVLAFLLELRKPVIRSSAQMQRETGLTPVVSVPELDTRRARFFPTRTG